MLDTADRKALRARAHHLDPVVMIGESGLTRAVLDETDRALRAHELIKVRVLGDDRAQRQAMSTEICSALGCTAVQSIGKLLVLYRPRPIEDGPRGDEPHVPKKRAAQGVTAPRKPGSRAGKATKRTTGGATGARVTTKRAIDGAAKGRSTAKRTASGTTNAHTGKAAPRERPAARTMGAPRAGKPAPTRAASKTRGGATQRSTRGVRTTGRTKKG